MAKKVVKFTAESLQDAGGHDLVMVSMIDENDAVVTRRVVGLEDYMEILGGSLKVEKPYVSVPASLLPGGYLGGRFAQEKGTYQILFKVPAEKRVLVHPSGHYMVPYPDLVFDVDVKGGSLRRAKVFVLGTEDELFQYPFGNVSTEGQICTGNIVFSGLGACVDSFTEAFFCSATNDDYFSPGNHIRPKFSQSEMLSKLNGKEVFPKRWLLPLDKTLRDLMRPYNQ